MNLEVISETTSAITLGWLPPPDIEWYLFYADDVRVANGTPFYERGARKGEPRDEVRFSKSANTYRVAAVTRSSPFALSLDVGEYSVDPVSSGDMPDRSLSAWLAQIPPVVPTTMLPLAQMRAPAPGEHVHVTGSGTLTTAQVDMLEHAKLASCGWIQFDDGIQLRGHFEVGITDGCRNLSIWGLDCRNDDGYGCRASNTVNFQWWGARIHDCAATGFHPHGNVAANTGMDVSLEIWNCGLDYSFDPHAEKGTGLHASYLGAGGEPTSGRFVIVGYDQPSGAIAQIGNHLEDSELWVDGRRATFVAQSQVAGNVLQWWGNNRNVIVHYVYGEDLAGRVSNAIGSHSGCVVEKGRHGGTVRLSPLYQPCTGITYQDCS
jgi:hypothetical protein